MQHACDAGSPCRIAPHRITTPPPPTRSHPPLPTPHPPHPPSPLTYTPLLFTRREIGITRNDNIIPTHKLEHHIRADLDASSSRALAVLRPLRCVITNLPDDHVELVEGKRFPGRDDSAYKMPFSKVGGGKGGSRD